MKNIKIMLFALVLSAFGLSSVQAGQFGVGVTGSMAVIEAHGTEKDTDGTTDTSVREATASNNAGIGSVFGEYSMDNGFTIGVDYIPGSADVNQKNLKRTDDSFEAAQDGDRTAQATVENHITVYAEIPIHAGLYVKGGYTEMDVNTKESFSGTGNNTYGNASVDGVLYGLGYKNTFGSNGFYKVEGTHTEFDTITINDSVTDKGNKITADLDVTQVTFGIGYAF